jgi:hypothetical protein
LESLLSKTKKELRELQDHEEEIKNILWRLTSKIKALEENKYQE